MTAAGDMGAVIGAVLIGVDTAGVAPMGAALDPPLASAGATGAAIGAADGAPGMLATGFVVLPPPHPALTIDKTIR